MNNEEKQSSLKVVEVEKADSVNIYGSYNQININSSNPVMNIKVQAEEQQPSSEREEQEELGEEALALSTYIYNKEKLDDYVQMIAACNNATDLARVIINLMEMDSKLTPEIVVKGSFLEVLRKIAYKLVERGRGCSIDNIRARVNDALAKRPKKHKMLPDSNS